MELESNGKNVKVVVPEGKGPGDEVEVTTWKDNKEVEELVPLNIATRFRIGEKDKKLYKIDLNGEKQVCLVCHSGLCCQMC